MNERYQVKTVPYKSGYGEKKVVIDTHNNDEPVRSFCCLSDDYAYTNSRAYARELNEKENV